MISALLVTIMFVATAGPAPAHVDCNYPLSNLLPSLNEPDDAALRTSATKYIPIKDTPFVEHVRGTLTPDETARISVLLDRLPDLGAVKSDGLHGAMATSVATRDVTTWIGTAKGLFVAKSPANEPSLYENYGVDGPLSTRITALVFDSTGTLWVGTPLGLSLLKTDGAWSHLRGRDGLPCEDITCLAVDKRDNVWIGTSRGAVLYRPYAKGRQWFYRAGHRYIPGDNVEAIALSDDGMPAYFKTSDGIGRLDAVEMTMKKRADIIEKRLNERHRRMGLVAACTLDNAENPKDHLIIDDDNDGLWTSYHVAAMSLAYAVTGDEAYKKSARDGMHAMIMLQNASGVPGLVARSMLPVEEGEKKRQELQSSSSELKHEQWRPTPDRKMYWKTDTSSDEIDGHYFAFYTYWEHIAKNDPDEDALIRKQVREVTDYIVDHGYYLLDWNGKPTTWGKWAPEVLNDDPRRYGENGLGSLEILSFLRTAYHITGDDKYRKDFDDLACKHGYVNNLQLIKKSFPDEDNHSDNQLACCAYYPILQIEQDPKVREVLQKAVRRHYKIISSEKSTFFDYVFATIDPDYVDIAGATQTLRDVPTDRRMWRMVNSNRADIQFAARPNRHGDRVLTQVLPADERNWGKWNIDPFVPDGGGDIAEHVSGSPLSPHNLRGFGDQRHGDGRNEDDGASWLLAYWMGRYHGFIAN